MSNARSEFQTRIGNLGTALKAQVLVGNPLNPTVDGPAALMRNGLAVVSFAILEDFIRRRAGEVMSRVGNGPTPFISLPTQVRSAAIRGALSGLAFQERIVDEPLWVAMAQTHSDRVASTARNPYQLSEFAFGYDQSNLDVKTVTAILEAFKVDNPWSCIGGVASRCGVGTPALKDSLREAAKRRHAAAHQANASVPHAELVSFSRDAVGIGIGFDLLLTKALRRILDGDSQYLGNGGKVVGKDVKIRTLETRRDGSVKEQTESGKRAVRVHPDESTAWAQCVVRARSQGEAVVLQDLAGFPIAWRVPDTD